MSHKLLLVILIVFSIGLCSGQVLQFGTCVDVETMRYFDLVRFLGQWYEIERFPAWFEDYGQCAYKRFQYCNRRVEIEHVFIRDGVQFVLHMNSTYNPGDEAIFDIEVNNIDPVGIPLSVISTDYTNYAVVYGCKNNEQLGIKYILAWILSRNTTLDEEILQKAHNELNSIPYASVAYLKHVDQREEKCNFHWTAHVQAVSLNDEGAK